MYIALHPKVMFQNIFFLVIFFAFIYFLIKLLVVNLLEQSAMIYSCKTIAIIIVIILSFTTCRSTWVFRTKQSVELLTFYEFFIVIFFEKVILFLLNLQADFFVHLLYHI